MGENKTGVSERGSTRGRHQKRKICKDRKREGVDKKKGKGGATDASGLETSETKRNQHDEENGAPLNRGDK